MFEAGMGGRDLGTGIGGCVFEAGMSGRGLGTGMGGCGARPGMKGRAIAGEPRNSPSSSADECVLEAIERFICTTQKHINIRTGQGH